jgi:hypothetical protein
MGCEVVKSGISAEKFLRKFLPPISGGKSDKTEEPSILKMKTAYSSEKSAKIYKTSRCHNSGDSNVHFDLVNLITHSASFSFSLIQK